MFPIPDVPDRPAAGHSRQSLDQGTVGLVLFRQPLTSLSLDMLTVGQQLGKRPLSVLASHLIFTEGLADRLDLDTARLCAFLRRVEDGYGPLPYHNRLHAADVLQRTHAIVHRSPLSDVHRLCLYVAAACHDVDHLGFTNSFLVSTDHPLARRYHNRSPQENHHTAATLELLRNPAYDFLPPALAPVLRDVVTDLILATDISLHVQVLQNTADPLWPLKVCLKSADIGHMALPRRIHRRWADMFMEEMQQQERFETEQGLPLTLPALKATEDRFMDFIVIPLFEKLSELFPSGRALWSGAVSNRSELSQ